MANSTKIPSKLDGNQVLQSAFNDGDRTIGTSSFITGKAGRKITQTTATTSIADDTLVFSYIEDGVQLMELTVVYTDATQTVLLSVERTA